MRGGGVKGAGGKFVQIVWGSTNQGLPLCQWARDAVSVRLRVVRLSNLTP